MAAVVTELVTSREWQWNPARVVFHYQISDTSSDTAAKTALLAEAATTYEGLTRDAISGPSPEWVDTVTDDGLWNAEVTYIVPASIIRPPLAIGESRYSFDIGGGTQHITQGLAHIETYVAAGAKPDYKGAINVSKQGGELTVEGVDIIMSAYAFSETHVLAAASVDDAYKNKLFALASHTNQAEFRGFAIGECLFVNANGSSRGDGDYEITFNFLASPNITGRTIGDIPGIEKKGWEYLWVQYEDVKDAVANKVVKQPTAVFVEQVYYAGDFDDLGI